MGYSHLGHAMTSFHDFMPRGLLQSTIYTVNIVNVLQSIDQQTRLSTMIIVANIDNIVGIKALDVLRISSFRDLLIGLLPSCTGNI